MPPHKQATLVENLASSARPATEGCVKDTVPISSSFLLFAVVVFGPQYEPAGSPDLLSPEHPSLEPAAALHADTAMESQAHVSGRGVLDSKGSKAEGRPGAVLGCLGDFVSGLLRGSHGLSMEAVWVYYIS